MRILQLTLLLLTSLSGTGCHLKSDQAATEAVVPPAGARGWALMDPSLMKSEVPPVSPGEAGSAGGAIPEGGTAAIVEGGMFDFSTVMQSNSRGTSRVAWKQSAAEAVDQARLMGKPLLVFFTSQNSPAAITMERTMGLAEPFRVLTEQQFIPLRIDFSDKDTRDSEFYKAFKERLVPSGYPTMLVVLPDGTEITRLSGYKTEYQDSYIKRLQLAVDQSKKAVELRRTKMAKEGYRLWTNKKEVEVFARLSSLDANMGTFTGEWGNTFTTFITRLSDKDQAWIEEQKRLRQGS